MAYLLMCMNLGLFYNEMLSKGNNFAEALIAYALILLVGIIIFHYLKVIELKKVPIKK